MIPASGRIAGALDHWSIETPDAVAASDGERQWTYAQLREQASTVAQVLLGSALRPGDRIALLDGNSLEWLAWYYGCSMAGVVPVPLNTRFAPAEWEFQLTHSGARLVLARAEFAGRLDSIADRVPGLRTRIAVDGDPGGLWETFEEAAERTSGRPVPGGGDLPGDELYQMYTSGTTGRPKGAVLTHRAVLANVRQFLDTGRLRTGERALVMMPLFHAGAAVGALTYITAGMHIRVMPAFDAEHCVEILESERIHVTTMVPVMISGVLDAVPGLVRRDLTALHTLFYGASTIPEATLRRALDAFGCDFVQAYGMTECSSTVTLLLGDDHRRALRDNPGLLLSCGRPISADTELRVVDAEGRDLPPGRVGEIVVRGPQLMAGYWRDPGATAKALEGGWMHTGDAGRFDDDGYLYVADRVKDMIVSGGENVYPREIEDVLSRMDAVAEAAVVGVPDDRWGEVPLAFLVIREGRTVTLDQVIAHCRRYLAGYKVPRRIECVADLPRNATGKVLKAELRAPYWTGRIRKV
ncbi:long-chain-fatty-acid--CoA ligase [Actinomadura sp. KC345]|uniref:long-chain-fatty-acid--CoA ligase n=1 Tax=Actinomadura sp. KC345 TaxID=2530371 RepID=UPI0010466A48|nr:long-chain-fatty-acid--CoA ligase [Actinomadura sp. KC345]TDC55620.1 long-chain-fatty-acid--CoA ligase [Actinomadura sp. KC345]